MFLMLKEILKMAKVCLSLFCVNLCYSRMIARLPSISSGGEIICDNKDEARTIITLQIPSPISSSFVGKIQKEMRG